jgi:hypothetical protein
MIGAACREGLAHSIHRLPEVYFTTGITTWWNAGTCPADRGRQIDADRQAARPDCGLVSVEEVERSKI